MADQTGLPFDVTGLRALTYSLDVDGKPSNTKEAVSALQQRLTACIAHDLVDSPLYQLVDALQPPPIDRERCDIFRERAAYSVETKTRLAEARAEGNVEAIRSVEERLGDTSVLEAGVAIDLLLSYRAVEGYANMIGLVSRMDRTLAQTVLVREQLAFAQNRLGRSREAEETLKQVIAARGPSSETNGLLGRVYKDRWEKAVKAEEVYAARSLLKQAIETYLAGFEADWRDAYPGINAVTLMEIDDDPRRHALIPVVRYAAERRLARKGQADYWDHATRLELAILAADAGAAADALGDALANVREKWELETTARNLRLIAETRVARGADAGGIEKVLAELGKRAATMGS
jgi:tetratricopeptide (TPR) repeat protein